jgi:sterol desaturase/sphingolipid hydroxylase (fatty acid hydroxylase superfamily)
MPDISILFSALPEVETLLLYVLGCFLVAGPYFLFQRLTGRKTSAKASWFPKDVYFRVSTLNDFVFLKLTPFILALPIIGSLYHSKPFFEKGMANLLSLFLPAGVLGEGGIGAAVLVFFLKLILFDLGMFVLHYAMHKVPLFWVFHKVHHSAEVLTPMTGSRHHPALYILYFVLGLFAGSVDGAYQYLYTATVTTPPIFDFLYFVLYGILYTLQHTHHWIDYGPLGLIFVSPADHQVHHSDNPEHFDKNFGMFFTVWDRMLGTYCRRQGHIKFGLGAETKNYRTFTDLIFRPFAEAWALRPFTRCRHSKCPDLHQSLCTCCCRTASANDCQAYFRPCPMPNSF